MKDFPPIITAYADPDAPTPAMGTPAAFLRWLLRDQGWLFVAATIVSIAWMVPMTVGPWLVGHIIDVGVTAHDAGATARWLLLLGLVVVIGPGVGWIYHTFVVRQWLLALYGTQNLAANKAIELGHILPRRVPTGEVLSVAGSDADQFGAFSEIVVRAISRIVACLAIAGIVLATSPRLGLVLLIAAPILVALGIPLTRPLERRQAAERSRTSTLTSMAADIVAGLRILRGIGGERTFGDAYAVQSESARRAGLAAGRWQAAVDGVGVAFAGILVVLLTGLGVAEVGAGRMTVGDLVAFLGYGLFLMEPMRDFFELLRKWTSSKVAAIKTTAVLRHTSPFPAVPAPGTTAADGALVDTVSGLEVAPGSLTMVVSADPDQSAALADRLGRYLPGGSDDSIPEIDDELTGKAARDARAERDALVAAVRDRDEARASGAWGVTYGGRDLADLPLHQVRETILVSDTAPALFAGTLQEAIDPHGRLTREQAEQAMTAASAEDVFDALPGGWQGRLDEKGRGLSGGQRQRLVLARALACDPPVLVLVEPTSAVDAHTEARIAARLRAARGTGTTVVMTASPLLLHHADQVALLVDGRVSAAGTHEELLRVPAYAEVVARGADAEPDAAPYDHRTDDPTHDLQEQR